MKKVIRLNFNPSKPYEELGDLVPILEPYFIGARNHTKEESFIAGMAYFYSTFYSRPPFQKEGQINISSSVAPPEIFFDWPTNNGPWDDDESDGESGEPAIQILVEGHFAGYYLPRLHTLIATDWSHNQRCVKVAQEVVAALAAEGILKPLSAKEKKRLFREATKKLDLKVTVGCDPEFEPWYGRQLLSAVDLVDFGGSIGRDGEGNQIEFRPKKGTPKEVVRNLRSLIKEFAGRFPGVELDAAGHQYSCGGHIHVGVGLEIEPSKDLLDLLDDFVGRPSLRLSGNARGSYAVLSAWEPKPWGFEYRTPPACIFAHPRVARVVLKLVRNLVRKFYSGQVIQYSVPPTRDDYIRVGELTVWETDFLLKFFRQDVPRRLPLRAAWGAPKPKFKASVSVAFRDDWRDDRRAWFRENLLKKLPRKRNIEIEKVVLYGLRKDRGVVATIPGIPGVAVLKNPPCEERSGSSIWIGLPWVIRMEDVPEKFLRATVQAIAHHVRVLLRG